MKQSDTFTSRITAGLSAIEWPLLLFLLLFTTDMVVLKPVGLLAGLWLYRKQGLGRHLAAAPPFYWLLPAMELIRFLFFNHDFSLAHWIMTGVGMAFWLMAAGAFGVLRAAVARGGAGRIMPTLSAWFWLNCLWSVGQLVRVIVISGHPNPYWLEVEAYGNSTGDFIRGLLGGPCYLNMFVNAFFAVFFLYRGKYRLSLAATTVALLTASNFANMVFLPVLLLIGLLRRERKIRIALAGHLGIFALCYLVIFPDNLAYLLSSVHQDKLAGRIYTMIRPLKSRQQAETPAAVTVVPALLQRSGKLASFRQTAGFLTSDAAAFCFGAGMGHYSSQVAVRMSDLQPERKSRLFQLLPQYIHPLFRRDHYRIYQAVYSLPPAYHSIRHMPGSFVNQLGGEYGLAGILLAAWGYVGYMLRRYRQFSYTGPLLLLAGGFLLFDYLFEYLSVLVFFELFFLTDTCRQQEDKATAS